MPLPRRAQVPARSTSRAAPRASREIARRLARNCIRAPRNQTRADRLACARILPRCFPDSRASIPAGLRRARSLQSPGRSARGCSCSRESGLRALRARTDRRPASVGQMDMQTSTPNCSPSGGKVRRTVHTQHRTLNRCGRRPVPHDPPAPARPTLKCSEEGQSISDLSPQMQESPALCRRHAPKEGGRAHQHTGAQHKLRPCSNRP